MTNDLPSVGTEDARPVTTADDCALAERLAFWFPEREESIEAAAAIWRLVSERDELASRVRALEGLPKALREAAGHLSAIMGEEIAEARVIRHFLPDELEGFALMVEDLASKEQP